jgi:hypothetical protein
MDELWKIDLNISARGNLDFMTDNVFDNPVLADIAKNWEKFYENFSKIFFTAVRILGNRALTLNLRTKNCLSPELYGIGFFNAHEVNIKKLQLGCLLNNRGEYFTLEQFQRSTQVPVNARMHIVLKKIFETARTRYEVSGSESVSRFFRNWKRGSGVIRRISKNLKSSGIPHCIVKFAETTETVKNYETAKQIIFCGLNLISHRDNEPLYTSYTIIF